MIVKFKKLSDTATTPHRAHHNDAGYDLFADEDIEIQYGETVKIQTNIAIELPDGYVADIRNRSGLTLKTNLRVHYGTIDAGYRDGIGIICGNNSMPVFGQDGTILAKTCTVPKGSKIAQLVIHKLPEIELVETQELSDSERGLNGFGSTDNKEGE